LRNQSDKTLKQKTSLNETETEFSPVAITTVDEENSVYANLNASLAEIRKLKGVTGYILRSNTEAIIDLNEQDKITEYAILSSQMNESSQEIVKQFNLGETESILVEGKNVKVLCMSIGENKISIFMEKTATHAWIIKRILL
jgi:predicted regulator of Ras-like GTPase activity (Roadblock/LC7/MglB family)